LNEAELEVESHNASYQKKLEVIKEQEELIEDEKEQEQKEEEARRRKRQAEERAKREEEARLAESLLPDSEVWDLVSRKMVSLIKIVAATSSRGSRDGEDQKCSDDG
jgi:hypothetical protein